MAWNGNHSQRGERGPASPHHCGRQQVTRCAICGLPTNRRFLDADDRCGDCRLALLKMAAEDRRENGRKRNL